MPFDDHYVRPERVAVWADIQPSLVGKNVSISFHNHSSHPVKFYVRGVLPKGAIVSLDGNTTWTTTFPLDLQADEVMITRNDAEGDFVAQHVGIFR